MNLFLSLLALFICHVSEAMNRLEPLNRESLSQIVPLMFQNCSYQGSQTCWKSIYTVVFGQVENSRDLFIHHSDHHLLVFPQPKAPFGDAHEVRVQCRQGQEQFHFQALVALARKTLIRRLSGEFIEYLPFSLSEGCLEIPLAPPEEDFILQQWRFVCREPQVDQKEEIWRKCLTRAKGIGLQLCAGGIISVYLSLEGNDRIDGEIFKVGDTNNRRTDFLAFAKIDLSSKEKIIDAFSKSKVIPIVSLEQSNVIQAKKSCDKNILYDIIDNPLQGTFSRKVSSFGPGFSACSEPLTDILMYGRNRLEQRLWSITPISVLFACKIASLSGRGRPSDIKLSHISLNNPAVNEFVFSIQSLQDEDEKLYESYRFLHNFIKRCESDADMFSVAELLAKSEQIVLDHQKLLFDEATVSKNSLSITAEESIQELQIAKYKRSDIIIPLEKFCDVLKGGFKEDTEFKVQIPNNYQMPISIVRAYHAKECNVPLVRIQTGGDENVCVLTALGALTREEVKNIIRASLLRQTHLLAQMV